MLKKISYSVVYILLGISLSTCDILTEPNIWLNDDDFFPLKVNWNSSNSIVCFGTSITNGKRSSNTIITIVPAPPPPLDSSYPKLLSEKLRIKVLNKGYWGAKIDYAKSIFVDSVLSQNPVLVFLEFGANEFLQNMDPLLTEQKLDSLITLIKSHNIEIVLLSFYNPDMISTTAANHFLIGRKALADKYFEMYKRISLKHRILMDDYMLKNIWGKEEFMSTDQLHPNNKGNAVLTQNILTSF